MEEFGLVYQGDEEDELTAQERKAQYDGIPEEPVSLEDGYWLMRNHCGEISFSYWSEATGYTREQIISLAEGKLIWQDPVSYVHSGENPYAGWLPKERYLMGNRMRKYKDAVRLHRKYGRFAANIRLLKENLPEEASGEEIHVNLGSTWVLNVEGFLPGFLAQLLEMRIPPKVEYDSWRGRWTVECSEEPNRVLNYYTYGTERMSAVRIITKKLNARPVRVYDQVPRADRAGTEAVLNQAETLAAQEKAKLIDASFQNYCHGDRRNEERLQEAFTSQYGYGICEFDGSHFEFADASRKIRMYRNQKDAVAHALASPNVLFADSVGTGKTIEYCCSVHELIRLGLARKAVISVPNSVLQAVYGVYSGLFPEDRTLLVRPGKDFSPANRGQFLEKMKSGEYQAVFMANSSFDRLTVTKEYAFRKKDRELRECAARLAAASSYSQKASLERHLSRKKKQIQKYKEEFQNTETACFDELGFDILVLDEAHHYKNISLDYSGGDIVGMHAKGSRKADNMLEKVQFIQEKRGRVIFATGTPVTNSLADLYVFMRYLMPEEMKACQIWHFNDWISTFGEEDHAFEVDVDSRSCRFTTRFSRFHNLPELMCLFSEVCHFYPGGGKEQALPDFRGYTDVVVKRSREQKEYIGELSERTEAIRAHEVDRREDNLLKVTAHGRMAALDIRLVKPDAEDRGEENKVRACARNMARLYSVYPGTTQIAFSDLSTPKEGFNIYDELKKELVLLGVKPEEILFIHDADSEEKRAEAEKNFNRGILRILVGSTQKLGTGSNVQERLIAVHHLDVPWRPSDMVQREGRILRQGNTCQEVFIFRYLTEASFDAYIYQLLENKQRFISQFLSGTLTAVHRSETDCTETVLSYAEVKALAIGNPLIRERVEVSNRLERARMNLRQKRKELSGLEELLERMPSMLAKRRLQIFHTVADMAYYEENRETVS